MNAPKMIMFDYGNTLMFEAEPDFLNGEKEVFKHIVKNPYNVTVDDACRLGTKIFKNFGACRKNGFEMHEWQFLKLQYDLLGIEFDIPYSEIEKILWDNAAKGGVMPYVEEMLEFLASNGIRSGVISNIGWSGSALADRINRFLPNNQFEFIIASSEYCVRKPNRMIFEVALKKANLSPEEVWYCGDSVSADVFGANGVNIFPVLYNELTIENPRRGENNISEIDFDYLYINDWREMLEVISKEHLNKYSCALM